MLLVFDNAEDADLLLDYLLGKPSVVKIIITMCDSREFPDLY